MTVLQPFVDRHAILSLEKQFHLFDVVGERSWSADLGAGTVTFGEHVMGAALPAPRPTGAGCGFCSRSTTRRSPSPSPRPRG